MDIKPIQSEQEYKKALKEIEFLFDAQWGTSEGNRLDMVTTLVEAYEAKYYPVNAN